MQCGSGIQNKVLEAMSCSAPAVVTPFALGGLAVGHGEHVLIGRDASEFADHVTRLLRDDPLRRRLAANARRLIDEKYTWERSVAELEGAYDQAIRDHCSPLRPGSPALTTAPQPAELALPASPQMRLAGRQLYLGAKRLFDILGALIGCLAVLILCPLVWLASRLTSPGDLFYWQERVGLDGRLFRMVKFRSMVMDAEANTGAVWAEVNDPRITPIGRILRKTRLDEAPQFWNVLRGEMSLIGPRPERPEFVRSLAEQIPTFAARHVVKPGITGWAQVNYRYVASVDDTLIKLQYDLYYIAHQEMALDILILLKTVRVMLELQGR